MWFDEEAEISVAEAAAIEAMKIPDFFIVGDCHWESLVRVRKRITVGHENQKLKIENRKSNTLRFC